MEPIITLPVFVLSLTVAILLTIILTVFFIKNNEVKRIESIKKEIIANTTEIAYLKGKDDGREKAFKAFSVEVVPFIEVKDSYFRKTAIYGYTTLIKLESFPISDPKRYVIGSIQKFKEENVNNLIETIDQHIDKLIAKIPGGIPVQKLATMLPPKK